jgi:phage terminase large subunit-like protein
MIGADTFTPWPHQIAPPSEWRQWVVYGDRDTGKTRGGTHWIQTKKETCGRIALIGPTWSYMRDVIVAGECGLLACAPRHDRPMFEPGSRRITWENGAFATLYSADNPEMLRGREFGCIWADEIWQWEEPHGYETYQLARFGLRRGEPKPQMLVTTYLFGSSLVREAIGQADIITEARRLPWAP